LPKIEPNWANAGGAASNAANASNANGQMRRAIVRDQKSGISVQGQEANCCATTVQDMEIRLYQGSGLRGHVAGIRASPDA
jgi:hypothetical protein